MGGWDYPDLNASGHRYLIIIYVIMHRLEKHALELLKNDTKVVEGKNFIKILDNRTGTHTPI